MEEVTSQNKKKVILVLVDSLMSRFIDEGIKNKQLPAFTYLIEKGQYYKNVVSSFPTMSVVIESSLLTGAYPDQHHVPGLIWYSAIENRLINYGTGNKEVIMGGMNESLEDYLIHLQRSHLNKERVTLYDELKLKNLTSGSINGLIYRGPTLQQLKFPGWISIPTTLPNTIEVMGPDFFTYGAFANSYNDILDLPDGITNNMGFNNDYALHTVDYLIKGNRVPDFLWVYLPDLDQEIHKKGPDYLESILELDRDIQELLSYFGSWEIAIQESIFIVIGDSGQTQILPSNQNSIIPLQLLLQRFRIVPTGRMITNDYDLVIAVNERMAYIYPLNPSLLLLEIAVHLKEDKRIDFIAWEENEWIYVLQSESGKRLQFHPTGEFQDIYDQKWTIDGDHEILDIKINKGSIEYQHYPDVLQRLYGALHSHQSPFLIVNAKPGFEFQGDYSPTHSNGGAHGSIHAEDSYVPLIIAGTSQKPKHLRIVDIKNFILELFK